MDFICFGGGTDMPITHLGGCKDRLSYIRLDHVSIGYHVGIDYKGCVVFGWIIAKGISG